MDARALSDWDTVYRTLQGNDDFASGVSLSDITESLGGLAQRVRSVDDRCYLPGFDQFFEDEQVLMFRRRNKRASLLAHEG